MPSVRIPGMMEIVEIPIMKSSMGQYEEMAEYMGCDLERLFFFGIEALVNAAWKDREHPMHPWIISIARKNNDFIDKHGHAYPGLKKTEIPPDQPGA